MSTKSKTNQLNHQLIAKRALESLDAIGILAEVLLNNGGHKGAPGDAVPPAQIDDRGEAGIQSAINIIARMAHRDVHDLATDLGIPA
ncbi:hypothetical protein [Pseudomonas putida]|uniref:hypothetical protein n=1 Tax=Pseudomonas putida TaxID=303 RepID=UPI002DB93AA5|nr:hypothetical protein [Pseudomonas putida]WRW04627.1 hypothetical protein VPZ82_04185 [Pseudomonas putida]